MTYTVEIPSDGEPTHCGSHSWPDESFFATPIDPDGTPYASPSEHAAAVTAGLTA